MQCTANRARSVLIDWAQHVVGFKQTLDRVGACVCNTGCRRVTLWVEGPKEAPDDWDIVKPIARIGFGDGCDGPEVEVDFKRGVVLDLTGCWTQIEIELVEKVAGMVAIPPIRYGVLTTCCGAGAARGEATRTTEKFGAGDHVVAIPPFAYAMRIQSEQNPVVFNNFVWTSGTNPVAGVNPQLANTIAVGTNVGSGANFLVHPPYVVPPVAQGATHIAFTVPMGAEVELVFLIGV